MKKLKWVLAVVALITAMKLSQAATLTPVNGSPGANAMWGLTCDQE